MARLPYLKRDEVPEDDRKFFDLTVTKPDAPGSRLFGVLAHAPNLMRRFGAFGNEILNKTQLDTNLRELAISMVGFLSASNYEFTYHWNLSLQVGIRREQLEKLGEWETSPVFNDHERAVLRYAVEATRNVRVSDATFDGLRSFLDHRRILELVESVAFYNAVVRILEPMQIEVEPGVKKN